MAEVFMWEIVLHHPPFLLQCLPTVFWTVVNPILHFMFVLLAKKNLTETISVCGLKLVITSQSVTLSYTSSVRLWGMERVIFTQNNYISLYLH